MRTIEVSDATYQRLLDQITEFGETAEDVIVRLLAMTSGAPQRQFADSPEPKRQVRAAPGSILPEREYWVPLLELLVAAGGSMPANDAIEAMGARMKTALTSRDYERLDQGEERWRNRVRFARLRMKEQGLLSAASRRGVWEITDDGRKFLDEA